MKSKNLLLSTILAVLCIGKTTAEQTFFAKDALTIKLGGELDTSLGFRMNNKYKDSLTPNHRTIRENTRAAVHASIVLSKLYGWDYGAQIGFKTTTCSCSAPGRDQLARTYVYAQNPNVGRIELGSRKSAGNSMKIHGGDVAVAAGGIDGGWPTFLSVDREGLGESNFIAGPSLVISEGGEHLGHHEKYRKLTFYTPVMNGFKIGLSYAPDASNAGNKSLLPNAGAPNSAPAKGAIKDRGSNVLSGGISWENKSGNQELKVSIVGEYAKYSLVYGNEKAAGLTFNPYKAVMVGGLYKYDNMSFAASYGNHFKSGFMRSEKVSDNYVCTLGAAYSFSNGAVSLGYLFSSKDSNIFNLISIGAEYSLAPGFISYAEVDYFNAHQKRKYTKVDLTGNSVVPSKFEITNVKNHGTTFIIGTKIQF